MNFINDHIEKFNRHRLEILSPSERLFVDEIFSRWYVLGGGWINLGLKKYVHMDNKIYSRC